MTYQINVDGLLVGTIYLVGISLLIAAPIGVLAAVYLNEYAKENWFTRIINLAVINLAGVPSIGHALFGLGAFVVFAGIGKSILAASLTLAIMTLPVIIASTKEALSAVPMAFREACWNTGASRWQTIKGVVLPNSITGILTGIILQVSRAAGETAPILFTGAVFYKAAERGDFLAYGLFDQCMGVFAHPPKMRNRKINRRVLPDLPCFCVSQKVDFMRRLDFVSQFMSRFSILTKSTSFWNKYGLSFRQK